jgi:hypothetical protein
VRRQIEERIRARVELRATAEGAPRALDVYARDYPRVREPLALYDAIRSLKPGLDLDTAIARAVFDVTPGGSYYYSLPNGRPANRDPFWFAVPNGACWPVGLPRFSTHAAAAVAVFEWGRHHGYSPEVAGGPAESDIGGDRLAEPEDRWMGALGTHPDHEYDVHVETLALAMVMPVALCRSQQLLHEAIAQAIESDPLPVEARKQIPNLWGPWLEDICRQYGVGTDVLAEEQE